MVDFWEEGWDDWENEGGRVYENRLDHFWEGEELEISAVNEFVRAKMDADWEPSESETFVSNIVGTRSEEEVQYRFTCLIADSIRHVKKFFFTRAEVAVEPTIAQQVGEFVTEIRRQLRSGFADFTEFRNLTNTEMWANVGVPSPSHHYQWSFNYPTKEGSAYMTLAKAQVLCDNAQKMAVTDKTMDEQFREINNGLNNLLRETTALDTLVYKAKEINAQADVVVGNLCAIAESLK